MENQRTPAPELNRLGQTPLFRRSLAEFHQLTGLAAKFVPASLTKPSLVVQIGQFIRQHLGERLTTRQTAAEFHLCEAYFCRHFRRLTGMTFHAYVRQLRVEKAKATLQATDARINEIALAHGFQSASDFNRIFKSSVGTTPSAFRGRRLQLRQSR